MSETSDDGGIPFPDYALLDRAGASQWMFFPAPDPARAARRERPPDRGRTEHQASRPPLHGAGTLRRGHWVPLLHGNGEVVSDHDGIDRLYREIGLDLFVAEFRGYGKSGGRASMAALVGDAMPALEYAAALQEERGGGPLFVMGRSMGTQPALEVAARAGDRVRGLIIESGAASARPRSRASASRRAGRASSIEAHETRSARSESPRCRSTRGGHLPRSSWRRSVPTAGERAPRVRPIEGAATRHPHGWPRTDVFAAIRRAPVDSVLSTRRSSGAGRSDRAVGEVGLEGP